MSKMHSPTARAPQRQRGHQRVADLLEAGAAVFAEKGYPATTMTEVAARAGAPIGSLYQFFPNKETLAKALLDRYGEHLREALARIQAQAAQLPAGALADALLGVLIALREERSAAMALLDAVGRNGLLLRDAMRKDIAAILRTRKPRLSAARADAMATVLQQLMKLAVNIHADGGGARGAPYVELREMARVYLEHRLQVAAGERPSARTSP